MQKKISKLPFKGTAEQEKKLREIIDANKHDKSLLMAVMQQAQDVYGYLPMEVQEMIAEGMDVPLERFTVFPPSMRSFRCHPRVSTTYPYVLAPRAMLKAREIFSTS